jgi:hypothetical protein
MADTKLPEGTDTVIEGAGSGGTSGGMGRSGTPQQGGSTSSISNSTGARTGTTASESGTDALITAGGPATETGADEGANKSGIRGMISTAGTKARDEAATRARGFVGQGLTSGSATLGNIASIIEDTVEQIGERLGPQYADYARTASQTVNRYASTLENKDPDELVDDARDLIRKSPGVALAGAAIVGFGLVRLLKAGIEEGQNGAGNRKGRGAS